MRCVPVSPNKCSLEYEVYRHQNATDEDFNNVDAIFKRILNEDKLLCNNTQKNMESTVYVNGQMHPTFEQGPLYFQKLVKQAVLEHRQEEQNERREIWPASQKTTGLTGTNEELEFCSGLSCNSESNTLAW
jgi:hypothetical protein